METATVGVLIALSASHMLNDVMQSLAPALYPVFHQQFALSFFQIGLITFVFQLTASFLQPLIGMSLDKRPLNFILPAGMAFTLVGLVLLAFANSYLLILLSVAVVGIGSAVFHPEASRVARAASGGRHGFAQSLFQVGGNFGQSLGPLLAAFIVVPFGQHSVLIFTVLALAAVVILTGVSRWYAAVRARPRKAAAATGPAHPRRVVLRTLFVLIVMLFSKVLYLSSLNSYYTFYLIQTFGVSIQSSQVLLFVFLASVAAGTFLGGPLVDRFGAKFVIWGSILGVLPFTLLLAPSRAYRHGDQFDRDRPHHLVGLLGDDRLCAGIDPRQCRGGGGPVLRPVASASAASARRCSACWRTRRASPSSITSAPSCRRSACWAASCRPRRARRSWRRRLEARRVAPPLPPKPAVPRLVGPRASVAGASMTLARRAATLQPHSRRS